MQLKEDNLYKFSTKSSSTFEKKIRLSQSSAFSLQLSGGDSINFAVPHIASYNRDFSSTKIRNTSQFNVFNSTISESSFVPKKDISVIKKENEYRIEEKTSITFQEKQAELSTSIINRYKIILRRIINNDIYESGNISDIEKYMDSKCNEKNLIFIKEAAQEIFWDNFRDAHIMQGILRLLSSKSYEEMKAQGQTICFALLNHEKITIRDQAIQTFQKWNSKKALKQLRSVYCPTVWMQKHMNKVIEYLELYGTE